MAIQHVVSAAHDRAAIDRDAVKRALYGSGITALPAAFSPAFVARLREDIDAADAGALAREGGSGRYHLELPPQRLRGFVEVVTHPWFTTVCETVLGSDYEVVRVGCDVTEPGAAAQPWHRDFPSPIATAKRRRLTSLVFTIACSDITPDLGPSELARGTQWETGTDWPDGMFPPASEWERYAALALTKLPRQGDLTARSALAIHRATANQSPDRRVVLAIGVAAPTESHTARNAPQLTPDRYAALPAVVRQHLVCRIVDELQPIVREPQLDGPVVA